MSKINVDYYPRIQMKYRDELGALMNEINYEMHSFGFQSSKTKNVLDNQRIVGDFELIFVTGGTAIITIKDEKLICSKGSIILIPPFVRHTLGTDDDDWHSNYFIHFDINPKSYILQFIQLLTSSSHSYIIKEYDKLLNIYTNIEKEITEKQTGYMAYVKGLLIEIFTTLARENIIEKPLKENQTNSSEHIIVDKAIKIIEYNIQDNYTVSDICNNLSISPTYLTRCFNKLIGLSPGRYIKLTKLKLVERELITTDMTIAQISEKYNFSSEYNLSNAFKGIYKKSPNNFRKSITNK